MWAKALLTVAICACLSACGGPKPHDSTDELIAEFHKLYNAEEFDAIYDRLMTPAFQRAISRDQFNHVLRENRSRMGDYKIGSHRNWSVESSQVTGTIIELVYTSQFADGVGYETFRIRALGEVVISDPKKNMTIVAGEDQDSALLINAYQFNIQQ